MFYIECVEITISNINFISYISRVSAGEAPVFLVAAASSCFIGKVIVNIPYGVIFSRENICKRLSAF
jgi:hypothetical protein